MGRRKAIAFGCAWGVLGGALMAGAAHVAMRKFLHYFVPSWRSGTKAWSIVAVIIGRLLIGYAVGTVTGVAPVFGAEIAKVNHIHSPDGYDHFP